MIDHEILLEAGAQEVELDKQETLFQIGDSARYYFQIVSGEIKMNNFNGEGQEFVQAIFSKGESFGEPPLFGDFPYPANAVAISNAKLLRLPKEKFLQLLTQHPKISLQFNAVLAKRLHYKATIAANNSIEDARLRILTVLDFLKDNVYKVEGKHTYLVEFTRQQIANLTGLRVETVIRTLKQLDAAGEVVIRDRKVWR